MEPAHLKLDISWIYSVGRYLTWIEYVSAQQEAINATESFTEK